MILFSPVHLIMTCGTPICNKAGSNGDRQKFMLQAQVSNTKLLFSGVMNIKSRKSELSRTFSKLFDS